MSSSDFPDSVPPSSQLLSSADFHRLADVPLVIEWFANIDNQQTRRSYQNAVEDFMKFIGTERLDEFREITRAHIIAGRDNLKYRDLSGTTIRHRLAALSAGEYQLYGSNLPSRQELSCRQGAWCNQTHCRLLCSNMAS